MSRRLVAGIDEAGVRPLLGPLVVAAAAYVVEHDEDVLHALVGRDPDDGLETADGDMLNATGTDLQRLESAALGHVLLARGDLPGQVAALLEHAVDFSTDELTELPWYAESLLDRPLPRRGESALLRRRAARHAQRLGALGLALHDVLVAPVLVPHFNRLSAQAGSKAWTLFDTTGRLIRRLVQRCPDDELVVHIHRQGGRLHYAPVLEAYFPLAPLSVLHERPDESAYRLDWPERGPVHVVFRLKARGARAPVAVASALAAYVRELFMECLNDWFVARVPGLTPTAGYGKDAQHFLLAVDRTLIESGASREQFVRCR